MKSYLMMSITVFSIMCTAHNSAQAAAKIEAGKDKYLGVGLLLQSHLRFDQNAAMANDTWSIDPYIRRARIMVLGQFTKRISFFVETDIPNFGKAGDYSGKMYLQDAVMEINLHEALQLDMGLILIPFSHYGMQGATSLMSLDYQHMIKYPGGSNLVWRDTGIMARGLLLDKKIEYRLAITNGVQSGYATEDTQTLPTLNKFDMPAVTGRLTYNVFETESGAGIGGLFWDSIYLKHDGQKLISPKKILSFGTSAMFQQDAVHSGTAGDVAATNYMALAADVFADIPIGDGTQAASGQVNYYYYDYGEANPMTGMGIAANAGYRINCIQPVVGFSWYDVKDAALAGDMMDIRLGLNWFFLGHNANIKFEVGGKKVDDAIEATEEEFALHGVVQAQLLY